MMVGNRKGKGKGGDGGGGGGGGGGGAVSIQSAGVGDKYPFGRDPELSAAVMLKQRAAKQFGVDISHIKSLSVAQAKYGREYPHRGGELPKKTVVVYLRHAMWTAPAPAITSGGGGGGDDGGNDGGGGEQERMLRRHELLRHHARLVLGMHYMARRDYEGAFKWYTDAAVHDESVAALLCMAAIVECTTTRRDWVMQLTKRAADLALSSGIRDEDRPPPGGGGDGSDAGGKRDSDDDSPREVFDEYFSEVYDPALANGGGLATMVDDFCASEGWSVQMGRAVRKQVRDVFFSFLLCEVIRDVAEVWDWDPIFVFVNNSARNQFATATAAHAMALRAAGMHDDAARYNSIAALYGDHRALFVESHRALARDRNGEFHRLSLLQRAIARGCRREAVLIEASDLYCRLFTQFERIRWPLVLEHAYHYGFLNDDFLSAESLLLTAVGTGSQVVQYKLGCLYRDLKIWLPSIPRESTKCFQMAATKGLRVEHDIVVALKALVGVGDVLKRTNYEEAISWYDVAMKKKDDKAFLALVARKDPQLAAVKAVVYEAAAKNAELRLERWRPDSEDSNMVNNVLQFGVKESDVRCLELFSVFSCRMAATQSKKRKEHRDAYRSTISLLQSMADKRADIVGKAKYMTQICHFEADKFELELQEAAAVLAAEVRTRESNADAWLCAVFNRIEQKEKDNVQHMSLGSSISLMIYPVMLKNMQEALRERDDDWGLLRSEVAQFRANNLLGIVGHMKDGSKWSLSTMAQAAMRQDKAVGMYNAAASIHVVADEYATALQLYEAALKVAEPTEVAEFKLVAAANDTDEAHAQLTAAKCADPQCKERAEAHFRLFELYGGRRAGVPASLRNIDKAAMNREEALLRRHDTLMMEEYKLEERRLLRAALRKGNQKGESIARERLKLLDEDTASYRLVSSKERKEMKLAAMDKKAAKTETKVKKKKKTTTTTKK